MASAPEKVAKADEVLVSESDILLELHKVGSSVQVAAIDTDSGLEVRFVVPSSAPRQAIAQLASRKLIYVRARQSEKRALPERIGTPKSELM